MAQPLFHAGEQRLLVARFDEDHSARKKPRLGERRCEQILARDAPEHLAARARRDAGGEQGRRGAINRAIPATRHLMQAAERQPSSRKAPVDLRQTERQHFPRTARPAFEALDALAKLGDGTDDGLRHDEKKAAPRGFARGLSAGMFFICSQLATESIGLAKDSSVTATIDQCE
ncbi:hypothetical protein ACFSKM_00640 [Ancylobacter dichloromethanicus]